MKDFYKASCPKCSGKGIIATYAASYNGVCFDCRGTGYIIRKTPIKPIFPWKTYQFFMQLSDSDPELKLYTATKDNSGHSAETILEKIKNIAKCGQYSRFADTMIIKEIV
jgi:hypothetical protein